MKARRTTKNTLNVHYITKFLAIWVFFGMIFLLSWCTLVTDTDHNVGTGEHYDLKDIQWYITTHRDSDPETRYQNSKELTNLRLLINYLISDFQYSKAATYLSELIQRTNDRDRNSMARLMLNTQGDTPWGLTQTQTLIHSYFVSGFIDESDYRYYTLTIDILSWQLEKEMINNLTWSYTDFKNLLRKQHDTYESYKDVPAYYLDALFAIAYFKIQQFGIANTLADRALKANPEYILPYQIKSYVWVLTKQPDHAKQALETLITIDSSKLERYQFLLWLMYYNQNDSTQASNYLLQMKSPNLRIEWLRYLIDINKRHITWDQTLLDKTLLRYYEELFDPTNQDKLKPIDFQSLFDRYMYDRIRVGTWWLVDAWSWYLTHPWLYDQALQICSTLISWDQSLCNYWIGARYVLQGDHKKALKTLIPLVKIYPQWQIYYLIGLLYYQQWLYDNAKVYFAKTLTFIWSDQKETLSTMMVDLLNAPNTP